MERLFRLGYEPALTLGNAKTIDILAYHPETEKQIRVSVKAVRSGGKWGVGRNDLSGENDLFFVLLIYKSFDDLSTSPEVYVMPAKDVEKCKRGWLNDTSAIYYSGEHKTDGFEQFKDAWHLIKENE